MKELRHLYWVINSPSLLSQESAELKKVRGENLLKLLDQGFLLKLKSGRLGDYFEQLVVYWLKDQLKLEPLFSGVPIRTPDQKTLGELDILFKNGEQFEHWEVAVKFYMCIAPSPEEAKGLNEFVGQALKDRLDIKLDHLLRHQLPLAHSSLALDKLRSLGITEPFESKIFMKGRLFYPLSWDWKHILGPSEVSTNHDRGWWISWNSHQGEHQLPSSNEKNIRWLLLPKHSWLRPLLSEIPPQNDEPLQSSQDVVDAINLHFSQTENAIQIEGIYEGQSTGRGILLRSNWPNSVASSTAK